MPATPSETEQLIRRGQMEGFNLLLTVISKLTEWQPEAKQFLGVGGDIQAEHRLLRADFANARQTAIEAKIIRALEQLRYHLIEASKHSGAERENNLNHVLLWLRYLGRINPNKNEVARIMASVWPWPQMMRAALTMVPEGGTTSIVSPGLAGLVENIKQALSGQPQPPPPPPPALQEGQETAEVIEEAEVTETAKNAPDS